MEERVSIQARIEKAAALERQGHEYRAQSKIHEAFRAFDEAGHLYRSVGDHLKASVCFASAGTCWNIHTGWQPLQRAALRHQMAAEEAMKASSYDYANSLFQDAALLFEKEGDFSAYSNCYIKSKVAWRKHLWAIVFGSRAGDVCSDPRHRSFGERVTAFLKCIFSLASYLLWGHGEKPFRTSGWALLVIAGATAYYDRTGLLVSSGGERIGDFFSALYFSVVTYTTVGYGDLLALEGARWVACFEALAGIVLTPLFLISLSRRYLRMSR
ncbi:MAG: ion channel [Candidatus Omnitrophota bacterium]